MNKPYDFIEMKIPSKPEYIGVIRLTVSGIASRMGFSYEDIDDLKVALSEAITNAVNHAYKDGNTGEVTIGFSVYKDRLEVRVSDSGMSFDSKDITYQTEPYNESSAIEDMREGGLGLFLIEALMDDVSINNKTGGVEIAMTKHLIRDEVGRGGNTISTSETK